MPDESQRPDDQEETQVPPEDNKPSRGYDPSRTTQDLRKHAEEALRMLRAARNQDEAAEMPAVTDPEDQADDADALTGNTTHDLADQARLAMQRMQSEAAERAETPLTPEEYFGAESRLRLDILETGSSLVVNLRDRAQVIGRMDNISSYKPDVDLTSFGGYRLGISRRHALLRRRGEYLEITDLYSRNGTHVNGTRLEPDQPRRLKNGDELHIGNLAMRVVFQHAG